MRHAVGVRKALGIRTIFNLLGPLTNPAGAQRQLIGASRAASAEKLAGAIERLGTKRALVVCGNDEFDEVCLWGPTSVFRVEDGRIECTVWKPETLALPQCRVDELRVAAPEDSARVIRSVLAGEAGPARNVVLANVAAALIAAGEAGEPLEGVAKGIEAIDSGRAAATLQRLIDVAAA
jgi:anthranilate phosphoribosyltransferase